MQVARLAALGRLVLHEEPAHVPGPGESLLRVQAAGLCGSDLHWYSEGTIGDALLARPLVLGHEVSGVIASGPREGQPVALDPAVPCGRCEVCLTGHRNLCPTVRFAGHGSVDGGLRELVARRRPGARPARRLRRGHRGRRCCAGGDLAVRAARPGGRVVLVGIPDDDVTTFRASVARRKGLTIAVARRMGDVYPRAIDLVQRGVVDAASVISHRYPLQDVGGAFAAAAQRTGLKVVVDLPGSP